MMVLILAGVMTAGAIAWALTPLWLNRSGAAARSAHDVAVFKSQLAEVERDAERGLISSAEAEGARREISRRLLAAADAAEREGAVAPAPKRAATAALIGSAAFVALLAGVVYAGLGTPGQPDAPLASRDLVAERQDARLTQAAAEKLFRDSLPADAPAPAAPQTPAGQPDFATLLTRMETAIANRPTDVHGRLLLARAYLRVERAAEAWPLFAEAAALMGVNAPTELYAEQGEAMVLAAGGYVSPGAEAAFERAAEMPISRYFLGLAAAQAGEAPTALVAWIQLLNEYPNAPFSGLLRSQIEETAAAEGLALRPGALPPPPTAALGPRVGAAPPAPAAEPSGPSQEDVAAVAAMSPEDRAAFMEGMLENALAELEDDPQQLDRWLMVIRSLTVMGRSDEAADAYRRASDAFAEDALALARLAAQAEAVGLGTD